METNSIETISGRRLTFFQLIQEYHIQIPIIQRDYAQGRPTANEIRDSFLDALLGYLDENIKNRDLDFVYGNQLNEAIDDINKFIPLDGQQRLTTLFLLHWYLANKDGNVEELRKHLVYNQNNENPKSKFSYETRTSSREFCDALLNCNIDFNNLLPADENKNNSLSKTIKDSSWYYLSWETDPTIQSMLVMLDDIHIKFQGKKDFFQRLVTLDNPVITFQFLDLKEFNLTDDLYIKMNARGIPLSPFENFKAKFEQYINKSAFNKKHSYSLEFSGSEKKVDLKTYFSHKIDTDWANLFWKHTLDDKKKFDKLIMNFIRAVMINNYAGTSNNESLKFLIDKKNENISFQQYLKFNCLDEKSITDLVSVLDLIKNGNNKVNEYISGFYYYNENEIFGTVVNNSFVQAGYVERIKFHAYCQYLIKWRNNNGFTDIEGLKNWMRVIHNLTENTAPYNNEKEFINSINAINLLIPNSNKILSHIINIDKLNGFDEIQFKEEKIKSLLISKGQAWIDLIHSIEQHGYFKGQIGFVIFLSGIEDYYNNNSNCSWSKNEDSDFQKAFINCIDKALAIFSDNGLVDFADYLWERALLAEDDYLIQEGSNQSFLINFDRDISWKRLLKRDKNGNHANIIKEIFNALDATKSVQSLTSVKDNYLTDDWRMKFIKTPKLFDYLGPKRYVRKISNHGFVLFSGERMSGAHAELYSYYYFLENLENKDFAPFEKADYYFAGGDDVDERPCAFLDNWQYENTSYAIDIIYSYDQCKYKLRFFYRETGTYSDKLKEILSSLNFGANNDSYVLFLPENEVLPKLNSLCKSFQKLTI